MMMMMMMHFSKCILVTDKGMCPCAIRGKGIKKAHREICTCVGSGVLCP